MDQQDVTAILERIKQVKVAVCGDFCLDAYWILDPEGGEVSVETGRMTQAVARQYYRLGGASNVVANLAALQPAAIKAIGVIGDELFGRELLRQLGQLGVDTESMVVQPEDYDTVVFAKPHLHDEEQTRIDFGFRKQRTPATVDTLIGHLTEALDTCDVVVLNQQVPGVLDEGRFIEQVNALLTDRPDKVVLLDSRHYAGRFRHVHLKTNAVEAAHLCGKNVPLDTVIDIKEVHHYARQLQQQYGKEAFITRGRRGLLVADEKDVHEIPGIQIMEKIDTVGAGDTVCASLALCLGAGVNPVDAAEFANFAAAVTVQKLFQTGTANAEEITAVSADPDYIYQPELAEDPRQRRFHDTSDIELCYDQTALPLGSVQHAVFDHDGTISTLREGWETIMEPVMVKAVLGPHYQHADETTYHRVLNRVRDYIDKSTGIQTILQMQALREMVEEFALTPPEDILDEFGYKQVYNDALMQMVRERLDRFHRGQLDLVDYTVKGAVAFLQTLRQRGVRLYLASGTDYDDVVAEANALGYADLFDGGIYGAVGDVSKYSKKMVIERIMADHQLSGAELAVFGDGPVEMRECRKRGGLAVGIASDEVRRHGLNDEKRARLIRAGAHLIAADFSQPEHLLALLGE